MIQIFRGAPVLVLLLTLPLIAADKSDENVRKDAKFFRVLDGRPDGKPTGQKIQPKHSKSTFHIESGAISFSDIQPGQDFDLPGCIAIRVISDHKWKLKLVATSPLKILDHTDLVPISRLKIRSPETADFVAFQEARPVLLAHGDKTNPAGELILADLRLRLEDEDPVGRYSSDFRVILEVE